MAGSKLTDMWQFELYIVGNNRRSAMALENLNDICRDYLNGHCQVDVFDIKEHPELTVIKQITAVPYLIKKYPLPERKMIGDLSDRARVLEGLNLDLPATLHGDRKYRQEYLKKEYFKLQHTQHPQ